MVVDRLAALLVLGDPRDAAIARGLADGAGLAVTIATSLAEARTAIAGATPAVILADATLPDGAVGELLRDGGPAVVALLAGDDDAAAIALLRAGALDVVVKSPSWPAELVRELTRARRAAAIHHERRAADVARRGRDAALVRLIEHASDLLWITDASFRFTFVSPAAAEIIGWTPEQLVAADQPPIIAPNDRARAQAMFRSLLDAPPDTTVTIEFELLHRDGHPVAAEMRAQVLRDDRGAPAGYRGITRDLRPRRAADETRRHVEAQLLQADKLESIGRLAGGVAHDLNNMLAPILGYADLLLLELPEDSPVRGDVEQILDAGRRSRDLVRQLLAFAQRHPMELAPTDLNAVIHRVSRLLRHTAPAGIVLETALGTDLGSLHADAGQLEHLLQHLARNAFDAMPDGGTLRVETTELVLDDDAAAAFGDLGAGTYALLTVTDTGVGMEPATLAQAFEPFFTTKPLGKGTGLGLSTVYGIVRQHGGATRAISAPGQGTTVQIWLPRADAIAVGRTTTARMGPVGGEAETILLVDDQDAVRAAIARMLRQSGYQVLEAASGALARALAAAHDGPIELVLTELFLVDVDGRKLVEELRRERPTLRGLLMSGYGRVAVDSGTTGEPALLDKPFSLHTLTRRLREALR
jgi:PAS domain S-box-containing protein